jgi:hypothetical protein
MDLLNLVSALPDPRVFPDADAAPPDDRELYLHAQEALAAGTSVIAAAADAELRAALQARLPAGGEPLARLLDAAPSVDVARHLWRLVEGLARGQPGDGLAATIFALPLVIVTGLEGTRGDGVIAGVLPDVDAIVALLREHRALGGNLTFGLANTLVGAEAFAVEHLGDWLRWQRLPEASGASLPPRNLAPQPLRFAAGQEAVHLRFLAGTALTGTTGHDPFASPRVGRWGVPLTRELGRQLGGDSVVVLALPRPLDRPLPAVELGRQAQREVSAQIFASNAIRHLRASVGEPTAVVSAHRVHGVVGSGELRLSLSSPFDLKDAQGFRCPLYPRERVADVAAMLVRLLGDCEVNDIRLLDGIHGDRVAGTTHPLLFKPATIPAGAELRLH